MNTTTENFECPDCLKTYKQRKHLQRHVSTHSTDRPFKCDFCESRFNRRDVLRRHFKRCPIRLERREPMPSGGIPGKPGRACRSCVSAKTACDCSWPCSACISKGQECIYNKRDEDEIPAADLTLDFPVGGVDETFMANFHSPEWWSWGDLQLFPRRQSDNNVQTSELNPSIWNLHRRSRFDFLLNLTQSMGLHQVFNYSRNQQWKTAATQISEISGSPVALDQSRATQTNQVLLTPNGWPNEIPISPSSLSYHNTATSTPARIEEIWLDDPIFTKTNELCDLLRPYLAISSKYKALKLNDGGAAHCLEFLNPVNLRKFMDIFFDRWYPHCPIIHKATFEIETAPAILLAPMVLLGACLSDSTDDYNKGVLYADIVEEFIFSYPPLSMYSAEEGTNIAPLIVIQAAYFICCLQTWEGDSLAKRRTRHHRAITLITAARDIGLSSSNYASYSHDAFSWASYIKNEETVRIFTYIFLLDSSFLIFSNTPPRMMLQELEMQLVCPEEAFQARNAEDCYAFLNSPATFQRGSFNRFTLVEAMEALARPDFDATLLEEFSNMSTLNLLSIISGIHTALFQLRMLLFCTPTNLESIKVSIERWNLAWGNRLEQLRKDGFCEVWEETGFTGHANEYASLAMARLENLEESLKWRAQGYSKAIKNEVLDDESMRPVTNLMLNLTVTGDSDMIYDEHP